MSDDKNDIAKYAETAKAVLDALSIRDLTQPGMAELGRAMGTLAGVANLVLIPLSILNSWAELKRNRFVDRLTETISAIPEESRVTPSKAILKSSLEGAVLAHDEDNDSIRDMFLKLLAGSMNAATDQPVHPGYADVISQMTSDEARIVSLFVNIQVFPVVSLQAARTTGWITLIDNFTNLGALAKCEHPERTRLYLDNIIRMSLARISPDESIANDIPYQDLENSSEIQRYINAVAMQHVSPYGNTMLDAPAIHIVRRLLRVTEFGLGFCSVCVAKPDIREGIVVATPA